MTLADGTILKQIMDMYTNSNNSNTERKDFASFLTIHEASMTEINPYGKTY